MGLCSSSHHPSDDDDTGRNAKNVNSDLNKELYRYREMGNNVVKILLLGEYVLE